MTVLENGELIGRDPVNIVVPPYAGANVMDWLLAAFGAIVAIIVGAVMLAVGVWSGFHAVKVTFGWPKASARIVRY